MSYERAGREFVFRAKLVFGLAVLGGVAGAVLRAAYLAEWPGEWGLPQWWMWLQKLIELGYSNELLIAAAAGAAALAGPVLFFLLKPRRSGPNF